MRLLAVSFVLLSACILTSPAWAQQSADPPQASTACTFDDGKEISIRYNPVLKGDELPRGKVWPAEASSMLLFTTTDLTIGGSTIPPGAYSLFVVPGKEQWTMIVNKDVTAGKKYDSNQDVARATMEMGELSQPTKEVKLTFGHMAPKDCNLRFYFGKVGVWTEFMQK
jgi:hypothetical protein